MKKKKSKKSSKNSKQHKRLSVITSNVYFVSILVFLILVFIILVKANMPITTLDQSGLNFLNQYEYPTANLTEEGCMHPYDVGDGVITFGPGLTYQTEQLGFDNLNQSLGTEYNSTNSCIDANHLLELQKMRLISYENIVVNIALKNNIKLTQGQFNALVLLAYNSPNLFNNPEFIEIISNPNSTFEEYVTSVDNYYREFADYDSKFGDGWYNRIVDSAQMYYYNDYIFQNV